MRLKELRKSRNVSQKEFAAYMKVSPQTVLNWENGLSEPSIKNLKAMADYFDVSIDYLVERDSSMKHLPADFVSNLPKESYLRIADDLMHFMDEEIKRLKEEDLNTESSPISKDK
jgi:transcriptional regulator with XRE-family HTH domain